MPNITVGELTDVPSPLDPINAQYMQETAHRIVHRFATVSAMNAWAAANGSMAFVTANGQTYHRAFGIWAPLLDGDPEWIAFTTVAPSGAWPFSNSQSRYMRVGRACYVNIVLSGFALPDSASPDGLNKTLRATLPVTATIESIAGSMYAVYSNNSIYVAAMVSFSGSSVTPFPHGIPLNPPGGINSQGFKSDFPVPTSSSTVLLSSVTIAGWYPIG